jgi:ABC-type antimicrobial peptide transport system permease subunit
MDAVMLFALTALLLAGLGIYGTISYFVGECTREIGVRIALGAQRKSILGMVLRKGLKLAIAGALMGLVVALIVSHLMAGLLYGVSPSDPLTFFGTNDCARSRCPRGMLYSCAKSNARGSYHRTAL